MSEEKFPIDETHDVLDIPVGENNVQVPIEISGKTRAGDDRWVVPEWWRKKQLSLQQWTTRPDFVIEVQDKPIVNYLTGATENSPFVFGIAPKSDPKQRFIDVLLAFNDIHNNTGKMLGKEPFDIMKDKELGQVKIKKKFLNLAKSIGLYTNRGDRPKVVKQASVIEKRIEDFQEKHPSVKRWLEESEYKQDFTNKGEVSGNLRKAVMIMDISPLELMNLSYGDKGIMIDPAKEGQKIEDVRDYESWLRKRWDQKTWTAIDGTKWSLKEWMSDNSPDRPYISGEGNEFTKKGDVVAQQKRGQAKQSSESQKKQILIATKHYFDTLGKVKGGKRGGTSIFVMPKIQLKYATLKMKAIEIQKMIQTLSEVKTSDQLTFEEESIYGLTEKIVEDTDDTDIIDATGHEDDLDKVEMIEKVAKKTYVTTQDDWDDALLYCLIALDVGWRATEGLTATYGTPSYWEIEGKDWGENYQTGVWIDPVEGIDKGIMMIKFLTRKTWGLHDKEGNPRTTHTEMILTQDTRDRVEAKLKKIKTGIEQYGKMKPEEIKEKYGIMQYKTVDGEKVPNFDHALIGSDDKYIKVESMKFPSKHKLSAKELREKRQAGKTIKKVIAQPEAQEKLHAIMRQAFIASGVNLDETSPSGKNIGRYWLTDTLHSLRHVFAQKWLLQSNWNYSYVARKGHWGATQILQEAYGGQGNDQFISDSIAFSKKSLEDAEREQKALLNFGKVEEDTASTFTSTTTTKGGKI